MGKLYKKNFGNTKLGNGHEVKFISPTKYLKNEGFFGIRNVKTRQDLTECEIYDTYRGLKERQMSNNIQIRNNAKHELKRLFPHGAYKPEQCS